MNANPKLFEVVMGNGFTPEGYLKPELMLSTEITLRDLFAAAALSGMVGDDSRSGQFSDFAQDAFRFADAMLAAREKP